MYGAQEQSWIPILDYAVLKGVSTSTLRRYIKAKKIPYKIENGRYLLLADAQMASQHSNAHRAGSATRHATTLQWDNASTQEGIAVFTRVRELEEKLLHAEEQISELKMLVAIYEEKLTQAGC